MTTPHPDLYSYQREGAEWLAKQRTGLLADEMGLGKTPQAISAADLINAKSILVVCPGVARINWQREFAVWQRTPRTLGCLMSGKDKPETDVVVTSYEMTTNRKMLIALLDREWDALIVDEAQAGKSPHSLRSKVLYGADFTARKGLASRAKRVWLLSGTPFPNGPHEFWTHTRALFHDACRGLERYSDWVNHFCVTIPGDYGDRIIGMRNADDFVSRLAPYIKRRHVEDVMPDLPELRFGHVVVQPANLPPRLIETQETERVVKAALARTQFMPGTDDLAAIASVQSMHLASLARWTGIAKAPAVAELLKTDLASGTHKVVVFARHKEVFGVIKQTVPDAFVINGDTSQSVRQSMIDKFQSLAPDSARVLVCHLDIASTALTLTAAHNVVFAETSWVPKDILQAAKRCHRIGQTKPVLARIVSLKGSLDETINDVIVRKYKSVSALEAEFVG